jgi:tetratricopeptide (TPR) repeat protein
MSTPIHLPLSNKLIVFCIDFVSKENKKQHLLSIIYRPGDHFKKAMIIENIGRVYTDKKDFNTALTYLSRSLDMHRRVLPDQNSDVARCIGSIEFVHEQKGDLDVALDYYHQQLKMEEQCLSFDHSDLSMHLDWIVNIYKKMGEIEAALEFCREKLNAQKNRLGENHSRVARTLMSMGNIQEDDNPNESLEYYEETLSILENSTLPNLKLIFDCLISMVCSYTEYDMNEDALRCEFKALELKRQTLSSDHIDIANNLRNISIHFVRKKYL